MKTEVIESGRTNDEILARRFVAIIAAVNGCGAIDEVLAGDFVAYLPYLRYPVRGSKRFQDHMKDFTSAFTRLQCDIDEVIADELTTTVRCTWRGVHTSGLFGIAATQRNIKFTQTHLLRISRSRISEDRVSANLPDLLHQLGDAQFGMLPAFSAYM